MGAGFAVFMVAAFRVLGVSISHYMINDISLSHGLPLLSTTNYNTTLQLLAVMVYCPQHDFPQ